MHLVGFYYKNYKKKIHIHRYRHTPKIYTVSAYAGRVKAPFSIHVQDADITENRYKSHHGFEQYQRSNPGFPEPETD